MNTISQEQTEATETIEAKFAELRKLRDAVYGPQSDNEWLVCRDRWLRDVDWLRAEASKLSVPSVASC